SGLATRLPQQAVVVPVLDSDPPLPVLYLPDPTVVLAVVETRDDVDLRALLVKLFDPRPVLRKPLIRILAASRSAFGLGCLGHICLLGFVDVFDREVVVRADAEMLREC